VRDSRVRVAVITGAHPYDVVGLQAAFRAMPELEAYPQSLEDFVTDTGGGHERYDAALFYNFHQETPAEDAPGWGKSAKRVLERLGEREQGIVMLHHGIAAFREWPLWSAICGMENRYYDWYPESTLRIEIAKPDHPITRGMSPWVMTDEPYVIPDPGEGNEVILTTDHAKSGRTLGWVRQYRRARVFCFQPGHDRRAYDDPNWRAVIARGVLWAAGRL